jgi:hypothetical protein
MLFSAAEHLAEGLCLNALFMLKVEYYLICLVRTRIQTAFLLDRQIILLFKILTRNKESKCRLE